jgi:predicted DCC family thiol-disulfide oxidoreductase YuxK
MSPGSLVLLYDGLCRFCDGTVQFILRHDPGGSLRFASLQGTYARDVVQRLPALSGVDSLILLEVTDKNRTRVRVRSDAALALARYLGWPWRLLGVLRVVPRPVRDALYDALARRRYRLFGRRDACRLPSPAEASRFLDPPASRRTANRDAV